MQLGFTLDIARKYYSPESLIQLISMLSENGYTYLHLHLSDDENYGIESLLLNQTVGNSWMEDGAFICKATRRKFLSTEQLQMVLSSARSHRIEVIPEIDSPAHMGGICKLYEKMYESAKAKNPLHGFSLQRLIVPSSGELNMSEPFAVNFMTALYSEVISIFGGTGKVHYFHIGADEFGGAETPEYQDFVPYANQLIRWLNQRGIIARMWNDGITRHTISELQGKFEVTYWTSGEHGRCTMQEVMDFGIPVFNYNRYYLYFLPGKNGNSLYILTSDIEKAAEDIEQVWEPGIWDANHLNSRITIGSQLVGVSLALWGEYVTELDENQIIACSSRLVESLAKKVKSL